MDITQREATPTLNRAMGLGALTMFGLAYLVPLTIFTTYGIVTEITGGRVALAYVVTLVAMVFTALSYTHMVRAYPVAGSAYTYTQRTFGGHAGFLAGWSLLLDYLFLPMINYLVIGIFLNAEFPAIPVWAWALAALSAVTGLNLVGVNSISRASKVIVTMQAVFVLVFVVLAARHAFSADAPGLTMPFTGDGSVSGLGPVLAGAAILCLSFLGFDAVSTMAEESRHPKTEIPRAILLVTLGGGFIFIALSVLSQLAYPQTTFENVDAAAVEVMNSVGGHLLQVAFIAAYVAGSFGSALTSAASVSRILFAMGREGVLPRTLGQLSARFRTPSAAVLVVGFLSLGVLAIDLGTLASLISFGALVAFTAVNLAVIKHYWVDQRERGGIASIHYLVLPTVGVLLVIWLWTSLSSQAITIGLAWLSIGALYLAVLTSGFRRQPPALSLEESALDESDLSHEE